MNTQQLIFHAWQWDWFALGVCASVIAIRLATPGRAGRSLILLWNSLTGTLESEGSKTSPNLARPEPIKLPRRRVFSLRFSRLCGFGVRGSDLKTEPQRREKRRENPLGERFRGNETKNNRKRDTTQFAGNLSFLAALGFLVLALFSPIRVLAESYLFSAHMLQHLILLLVVPPLLLCSLPAHPMRDHEPASPAWTAVGWLSGVGAMWLWHAPALCNAATTNQTVFRVQILSLLIFGILFWLPIFAPRRERRLAPLPGIAYLFSACVGCSLLGIYITFTPLTVCSIYAHPADPAGLLPLIRNGWGLDAAADQQFGGLLMWVPACFIYLLGILILLGRWYSAVDARRDVGTSSFTVPGPELNART